MPDLSDKELRSMILELLAPKFAGVQLEAGQISPDEDLYEIGVVDSYDVVELLSEITQKTGIEADIGNASDVGKYILSVNSLSRLFLSTP